MQIPPGMTETEVLATIEDVADRLARKFRGFSYYDEDDLRQEVTIMCLEALGRYEAEKGTLNAFLYRHAKNRITNLKRDRVRRTDSPCQKCFLADREGRRPDHHGDGAGFCSVYERWRSRNDKRAELATTKEANPNDDRWATLDDASTDAETDEIISLLNRKLDVEDRATWLRMKEGIKNIPKEKSERVMRAIARILAQAGVELRLPWAA